MQKYVTKVNFNVRSLPLFLMQILWPKHLLFFNTIYIALNLLDNLKFRQNLNLQVEKVKRKGTSWDLQVNEKSSFTESYGNHSVKVIILDREFFKSN